MKIVNMVLFALMVNFVFGQNNNPQGWSREYFIKNKISIASGYYYKFDKNGNLKQDIFLIYRHQFDDKENKIFEMGLGLPNKETYYNDIGQIIKCRKTMNGYGSPDCFIEEIDYEYDNLNREIKTVNKTIFQHYSEQDTMLLSQSTRSKVHEYVYNSNNQKTEWFCTKDSAKWCTKDLRTKEKSIEKYDSVTCFDCHSRYLCVKWEYDSLSNLTEETSFTQNNEIYFKKHYFYDDQNRLIKQVDSTGWNSTMPFLKRTITYEYTDTGKVETEKSIDDNKIHYIYYNNDGWCVKYCSGNASRKDCNEYSYFFKNNKLIKVILNSLGEVFVEKFYYDEKGFLKERQEMKDDKIISLVRYYYE